MPSVPSEADQQRFLADLTEAAGDRPVARAGLCVSGGPDSLALLLLAHATLPDFAAATVDHGLRPEAADEAEMVAALCGKLGVAHAILKLGDRPRGNISDWARRERYRALAQWAAEQHCNVLVTAHHADDQLETLIMRLNRGSGVGGLAGIRRRNGNIVRPLLGWRKAELEALVAACGVVAVDDISNRDDRFDRARLRKMLADADWLDPLAAARSTQALADADAALDWTAQAYFNRRTAMANGVLSFDPKALPRELLRRIALLCLRTFAADANPRGTELDRLIIGLDSERSMTLAGVRCIGGTFWLFSPAPPRRTH